MAELSELIQALLDPRAYPEPPQQVTLMQTQMSLVFLADDHVYKVKKPVDLGYLDYTSLKKRRFYCQREVELNQRLCPDVYQGVVAITRRGDIIEIGGEGRVIEYAVKMRRLPQEMMMDVLLADGKVTPEMVAGVAVKLAEFHAKAETGKTISVFGDLSTIIENTEENFSQTEKYLDRTITPERYRSIKSFTATFISDNSSLFTKRVEAGRIKDCHGDLHAAHVCFEDGIRIFDCIEFNDRFRYCDVASEVAFLAMDLDNYGQKTLSGHFVQAYVTQSRDRELLALLDFYKCYRAYVRGKVEGFKLDDPHIPPEEKARILAAARGYFELAESYLP